MTKPDRRAGWTTIAIHKATKPLAKELAALIQAERLAVGRLSLSEAVHAAIVEALSRRTPKENKDTAAQ